MQIPLQISFHGTPVTDEIDAACRKEVAKLERYAHDITSCRVVISTAQHRSVQGSLHEVRIDVTLPGHEIVVTRVPTEHARNEKLGLALREAFDTIRRRIEDAVRKRRGTVKAHETPPHGRIARMFLDERYGFIETPEGREIYFHADSLLKRDFASLAVGEQVRFVEEQGAKGPQATSVARVGSHHHLAP